VKILCVKGSAEENVAAVLETRFADQASLISATGTSTSMAESLSNKMTEDDFSSYLRSIVSDMIEVPNSLYTDDDE
jgi:hypothetical protein